MAHHDRRSLLARIGSLGCRDDCRRLDDVDVGDTLTYTSDASGWLSFDAATRTFSGTPLNGDVGTTTVTVTADESTQSKYAKDVMNR